MKLSRIGQTAQRRIKLEKKLKIKLETIEKAHVDNMGDIHCENLIGSTTLPLGVAGPLRIEGKATTGDFYIPLATTEGALVASVNRGCKALTFAGGVHVHACRVGTTRGPVFYTGSLEKSKQLVNWVNKNEKKLAIEASKTSSHLRLLKLYVEMLPSYVFIRFYFDTQEAMGMNMATVATQKIVEFIQRETGIRCLSISGNYCIDKKPAWINFINNRGFKAWAEAVIPKRILTKVLKSGAQQIFEVWLAKCMLGSAMSGSLGFNAHFANIVAAFFAATGQDLAHVVEGSLGITIVKPLPNDDLYFSIYMPSIMTGVVGGGTKLKTKQEALSIIGVKTSDALVEVLVGTVLAGELSLLSSLEEGSLARTHEKLGR